MRLFQVLAPNKSSSDRTRDLKAKNIFKDTKQTLKQSTLRYNNFNNSIRYTNQGGLKSIENNELKQILARGHALCGDTNCYISYGDNKTCSNNHEIGPTSVKVDTNTNLFSHYVKELTPDISMISSYDHTYCVAVKNDGMIIDTSCSETHADGNGIIFDPDGLYTDTNAVGNNNAISGIVKKKHLWNATIILGSQDISGCYQHCQGGSGVNLSLGNSTKQNYLASYDPNNKIMFNR